jgi:hypothetical protein
MSVKPNILELVKDEVYRKSLINSLCVGLSDTEHFTKIINYVIDYKFNLFIIDDFKGSFYEDEDDTLDLILPSIRRLYGKMFVTPPNILTEQNLKYFQLSFDIDDFLSYFIEMVSKSKNSLSMFENLDRTNETLTLIVDNYIAGLIKLVRENEDQVIRDIKINNIIRC